MMRDYGLVLGINIIGIGGLGIFAMGILVALPPSNPNNGFWFEFVWGGGFALCGLGLMCLWGFLLRKWWRGEWYD